MQPVCLNWIVACPHVLAPSVGAKTPYCCLTAIYIQQIYYFGFILLRIWGELNPLVCNCYVNYIEY